MNTILSLLVVLATGLFAFATFILAEHKDDIEKEENEKSNSFK